jgi:hypothetical protein
MSALSFRWTCCFFAGRAQGQPAGLVGVGGHSRQKRQRA